MNKNFELLEKKLNIANELMDELTFDDVKVQLPEVIMPDNYSPIEAVKGEEPKVELFNIESLKSDFLAIRNNVMKLINTGQRILESASVIDVSDMNPNLLNALSGMQATLGTNLKLMIALYKEIAEIERIRMKENKANGSSIAPSVNNGTVVTNNIVYSGSTSDLLEILANN